MCISFWRPAVLSLSRSNLHCFMSCQVVSLSSHEPFLTLSLSLSPLSRSLTSLYPCTLVQRRLSSFHSHSLSLEGVNSLTANVCRKGCKPTPSQKKTYPLRDAWGHGGKLTRFSSIRQLFEEFTCYSHSVKAIAHRVRNFHMHFSVFSYSSSFPIKMHATDAKCRKSNLIRIFFDGRTFRTLCRDL